MAMQSVNPATEDVIVTHEPLTDEALEAKIAQAQTTFEVWRKKSFAERAVPMRRLAELLRLQSTEIAMLATLEMGKPIRQAKAEVEKCAWVCEYYAQLAETILSPQDIATDATHSYTRFDPLGIVLAVMPWNYPFWQVFRFIAPAAMAGNVGLLKHASNVQLCGQKMEALFVEAGFPVGVFQNLAIESHRVEKVIRDERVRAVTLTGSELAGRKVASAAGDSIKKTVLELGGSDAFIVLEDADLDAAIAGAVTARTQNAGQSCIAAKRFLVHSSLVDAFTAKVKERFEALKIGDPALDETDVGPVVNQKSLEELLSQIDRSVAAGATVVSGGKRLEGKGFFLQPTILANVKPGVPAFDEETFGPIMAIISISSADEAVKLANLSPFGLGASVWTKDLAQAEQMALNLDVGSIFVNGIVKSDPRLPFGGTKHSGYGRELAAEGIKEFVNIKTIWIR